MKIYVVTDGDYSDYMIHGVFSTLEKAEIFKKYSKLDYIEVYELDDMQGIELNGYFKYDVYMDVDGNSEIELPDQRESIDRDIKPYGDGKRMVFEVKAKNEKHAVKIANEKRVQLIANGEWETDFSAWLRKRKVKYETNTKEKDAIT